MRARRALLVVAVAAVAVVAAALPAGAVEPFGSVVTVTEPPPGCAIGIVNGDASIGSGGIRGFVNFIGTGCAADDIWYVASSGAAGKKELSPYRGQVLASSQNGFSAYVLFANGSGIFLGRRLIGNGTFGAVQQLSSTTPGAVSPQGDVIAGSWAGSVDSWWAVWTEQVGPGGEFAQTELFQAKTYGGTLGRTQVTNHPDNDSQPALAFKPGGGGALAFIRDNGFGDEPTHSNLRLAQASGSTGVWAGQQLTAVGINTDPSIDTTSGPGGHIYLAWLRDGQVFESDNLSGTFQHKAFVSNARSTSISRSTGQTHVAWAQIGDGTVMAERIGNGAWTKATVQASPSRLDPIVVSFGPQAVVLMASSARIYKRTQLP
jgi:hypothetical protein